jgi:DmsE family decaheme c-type cytochrome
MRTKRFYQCLSFFVLAGILLLTGRGGAQEAEEAFGAACAVCHVETAKAFTGNIHSKIAHYGEEGNCESCHAGAVTHAERGDPTLVTNPSKLAAEKASETCMECHIKDKKQMFWQGSIHESQQLGCTTCHNVHGGMDNLLVKADQKGVCFSCHFDVRADLMKRSKHPLRDSSIPSGEGKMTCSDCHNPHGARSEALVDAKSINDKCYECHFEKKAPVLWEHSPVKEDCLVCHNAHGSSNDKLLVTKVPRLCQECHMQGRHQSGTLAENSVFAFNRSCLNCHSQVHGSNNPSGVVLQR